MFSQKGSLTPAQRAAIIERSRKVPADVLAKIIIERDDEDRDAIKRTAIEFALEHRTNDFLCLYYARRQDLIEGGMSANEVRRQAYADTVAAIKEEWLDPDGPFSELPKTTGITAADPYAETSSLSPFEEQARIERRVVAYLFAFCATLLGGFLFGLYRVFHH